RNVPWHIYNIEACDTAKQVFAGLDGLMEMVELKKDGELQKNAREIKERACLFMEEILEAGGYFEAVEAGFFVDSGNYPERNGDGIARKIAGGVGQGSIFKRDEDYFAPVTAHYGYNNVAQYDPSAVDNPAKLIGGCTFEDPGKIVYIDELDEEDNVHRRMEETAKYRGTSLLKPEMEWAADGTVMLTLFLPASRRVAEAAALELAAKMNLQDAQVINLEVMQEAEGVRIELKGRLPFDVDTAKLVIPPEPELLSDEEIRADVEKYPLRVVCGTVGEDEHSVGLREIIDIKHGGIERFGIEVHYLGTSVPVEKLVDAAIELNAEAILASTIISHDDIHYKGMKKLHELAVEKGIRDKLTIIAGGTQVVPKLAVQQGIDAGFGRGTHGIDVATFLVKHRRKKGYGV
ncbi:MAG: cobalamin-dependent protein, partial [Spirochaetaceae bacterium]|nr:cobalamin-dependent protein [Spirochaetaceae bacterium]